MVATAIAVALLVHLSLGSASAAGSIAVELDPNEEIIEIVDDDAAFTLVADLVKLAAAEDGDSAPGPKPEPQPVGPTDEEVDEVFANLNAAVGQLGWDLTQPAQRTKLDAEARKMRDNLAARGISKDERGGLSGADLNTLKANLDEIYATPTKCKGRCLASPGKKAARTLFITSLGILGTALTQVAAGKFRTDVFAVGTVLTVAASVATYLFTVLDDLRTAQADAIAARNRVVANQMLIVTAQFLADLVNDAQQTIADSTFGSARTSFSSVSSYMSALDADVRDLEAASTGGSDGDLRR
ncbi:hypothetical protein CA983_32855 [Streptomyces swartbergensis]|uniref:Uncharacterized protein n=2 Tax=Streptomyces swartbergensis TaxID=487165 RepID=A0A243RLG0_9ACTN|nr:hypothetical protein CA983_32855 [Streptomyces swartbergensis]